MADRLSSTEKLARLLDSTTLNVLTAVTLATGRRLEPEAIDAIRNALDPALRAARALGALQPGYPARDESDLLTDVVGPLPSHAVPGDTLRETQPGFRTSKRPRPPPK